MVQMEVKLMPRKDQRFDFEPGGLREMKMIGSMVLRIALSDVSESPICYSHYLASYTIGG